MMRFIGQNMRKLTAELFDLPKDVVLNLPRVTLIGPLQMTIENHRGVVHFSESELRLRLIEGELKIVGEKLRIRTISKEDVFVEGKITDVSFSRT